MKEIITKRIVLDAGEREIRKSWKTDWRKMMGDRKRHGMICILSGIWNGKVVHAEYVPFEHVAKVVLKAVRFADGTTMTVSMRTYDLENLLGERVFRKDGYGSLIREARASCREMYAVGGAKIPDGDHGAVRVKDGQVVSVDPTKVEEARTESGGQEEPWWLKG